VDSRAIALKVAGTMIAHRNKLAGKAAGIYQAHAALDEVAKTVHKHREEHHSTAATATSHWEGRTAAAFDKRAKRLSGYLRDTSQASTKGAEIVATTAQSLDGRHKAVSQLVEEYTNRATTVLDAGRAVTGAGQKAALLKAVAQVSDLVRDYTNESVRHLRATQGQLKDAAADLRKLERAVEHDGTFDAKRKPKHGKESGGKRPDHDATRPGSSGVRDKVKQVARGQLGYHEGPGNQNKYGPTGPWCSNFVTWTWRKAGVNIPILPFTGDVYDWGKDKGLAYGTNNFDQVRPGDALLFGTGPQSPETSTHIGIVDSVHGNQVTLIEGNSSDKVQRVTHTLSASTFYGGVHPR